MLGAGVGDMLCIINGAEVYANGWPLTKMNQVQTVAAATGTIRLGVDEVRCTDTATAAVTDLEYPDSLIPYRVKALKIYDADGRAGTNNITIKTTADAIIGTIAEDFGSLTISSDGTTAYVVE